MILLDDMMPADGQTPGAAGLTIGDELPQGQHRQMATRPAWQAAP